MATRHWLVPLLTLVGLLGGLEGVSRQLGLDKHQGMGLIRVEKEGPAEGGAAWAKGARAIGVDYLPTVFEQDAQGFTTRWGRCAYDHPGRTVLMFGDSTTRQTSPGVVQRSLPGSSIGAGEPALTWPELLKRSHAIPADVQVCVIAEVGYHPVDYRAFLRALNRRMKPALVIPLLCPNDLLVKTPVVALKTGAVFEGFQSNWTLTAWRPGFVPWLFDRSEAFRYAHFRLSRAYPQQAMPVPAKLGEGRMPGPALKALKEDPSSLRVFLLPHLDDGDLQVAGRKEAVEEASGVSLHLLSLSGPLAELRQSPQDPVHMNEDGHAQVASLVLPELLSALELPDAP